MQFTSTALALFLSSALAHEASYSASSVATTVAYVTSTAVNSTSAYHTVYATGTAPHSFVPTRMGSAAYGEATGYATHAGKNSTVSVHSPTLHHSSKTPALIAGTTSAAASTAEASASASSASASASATPSGGAAGRLEVQLSLLAVVGGAALLL